MSVPMTQAAAAVTVGPSDLAPVTLVAGHDDVEARTAWKDCDEFVASPARLQVWVRARHP
jgi:hypothetical protein